MVVKKGVTGRAIRTFKCQRGSNLESEQFVNLEQFVKFWCFPWLSVLRTL